MTSVRPARFLIGLTLAIVPAVCFAQETGSGEIVTGSGAVEPTLEDRLSALAEGASPLKEAVLPEGERDAWTGETKRYAERSAELRVRCREEIRKANRDTIVKIAGQCLRSDLLLEITHRRKQREFVDGDAANTIDRWIDAATVVVDGVDAGVFTTVDTLKTAKRNLHDEYRAPMLATITQSRLETFDAIVRALAFETKAALATSNVDPDEVLAELVPCLETASVHATVVTMAYSFMERFRLAATAVGDCIELAEDLSDR